MNESTKPGKTCFLQDFETLKILGQRLLFMGLDLFEKLVINDWNIFERLF